MFNFLLVAVLLATASGLVVVLKVFSSAVLRPAASWKRLAETYAYVGPEPERLSASAFGLAPLSTPLSTVAAFTEYGLFLRVDGMSLDPRPALVPWRHLRIALDVGWLVVLEVAPENTQFVFTRWFVGGENLRRIRSDGFGG